MSKKFKQSLEALSADQVTEKLGDMCEKIGLIRTDKEKGIVKTYFNLAGQIGDFNTLKFIAAGKNGLDGDKAGLAEIASAVEARGSQSAVKIQAYLELLREAKEAVYDNGYNAARRPIKLLKEFKRLR